MGMLYLLLTCYYLSFIDISRVTYKASTTPWRWQSFAETCRGRIWNALINSTTFLGICWLFYDTTRCSVELSRSVSNVLILNGSGVSVLHFGIIFFWTPSIVYYSKKNGTLGILHSFASSDSRESLLGPVMLEGLSFWSLPNLFTQGWKRC
jgi:hypothetical protein